MLKYFSTVMLAALVITTACLNACKNNSGPAVLSKEDSLKQQLDRGNYLVNSVVHCLHCHSQADFEKFSLPPKPGTEGGGGIAIHELDSTFPGRIVIPNITPNGLKDWTDQEIARAVTKGIRKNGDTLLPTMPYDVFSKMTGYDVDAVIAYIRTLKPIETNYPKRELFIPASMFGPLPANDYTTNIKPDTADKIKYGGYLVSIAGCKSCHTPVEGMPNAGKLFAGGNEDKFPTFTVRAANITPDTATGIGGWTEAMFIAKFRNNSTPENLSRNAGKQNTAMAWSFFGTMRDSDLKSIYAYLRSLSPVDNPVVKWPE
jgi:hypothetical protein